MSRLSCTFCAHRNPEGSQFCNQCGSPLHLVPCPQCEAINNASETHCYACGASLSEQPAEALVEAGYGEGAQSVESHPSVIEAGSAAPVTLANHLEDIPWDLPVRARDAEAREEAPVPTTDVAPEPIRREDTVPAYYRDPRVDYEARRSKWPKRIVLGCAFAAVAGAIYWSTWLPMQRSTPEAAQQAAPPPAVEAPPVTSKAPAPPSPTQATPRPAASSEPPPTDAVTAAPTDAPVAPAASEAASSVPAPAATQSPPVREKGAAKASARTTTDAQRRAAAQARTREQAMRDAQATQRLIERQLADVPRGDRSVPPTP